MKLEKKIIIEGIIEAKTGLHIGGSKETLKIGGSDNPVIRDAKGRIFIPGSSLKGKIRCLLERMYGAKDDNGNDRKTLEKKEDKGKPCACGKCVICKLFGPHNSKKIKEIRRLIFRDAYLIDNDGNIVPPWEAREKYIEIKPENVIDRITGTAQHPRFIERVVAGSKFKFEIILDVLENDCLEENNYIEENLNTLIKGMKLLENDYLGGNGSRGYGKIKFEKIKIKVFDPKEGKDEEILNEIELDSINVNEIVKKVKGE